MFTVIVLGFEKRMPASPTAAHTMDTTPTTPTRIRLTRWRRVNFMAYRPPPVVVIMNADNPPSCDWEVAFREFPLADPAPRLTSPVWAGSLMPGIVGVPVT